MNGRSGASAIRMLAVLAGLVAAVDTASAQQSTAPAAGQAAPSGTLTIGVPWDPGTMDPQMHRVRYTQIISHAMRDKLVFQAPPGLVIGPLLLETFTQVDDTTYDLKIRQGVLFHNGDELTADDVVYTFTRLIDPATKSPRATMGNWTSVDGFEATDRYTVRWKTKVPFGSPDEALRGFSFSSQEILHKATYEKLTLEEAAKAPVVGVGPFKFADWVPDQHIIMDAFADYWQGAPGVERIVWRAIPEESSRVAELMAGSVDMIYPVSPDFVNQLRDAKMQLEVVPGTSARMLQMNMQDGSPFADPEVRRAMNIAINKQDLVDNLFQGLAIPYGQVAGVGQEGYVEGRDPFKYDPDAARAILSKITQPIELLTQQTNELPAEAIAEQLRAYGMNVTAVVIDNAAATKVSDDGSFDLLFYTAGFGGGDFNATYSNNFLCSRLDANQVRTGFCNKDLDAEFQAARNERDPAARKAMIEEIVRSLTEEHMPWVPLFGQAEVWAMQPYVKGFVGSSAGQMFDLHKVTLEK